MMTAREVADYTGFSIDHVRTMIRNKQLKAKQYKFPHQPGYYYLVDKKDADRLKNRPKDNRGTYDRKEAKKKRAAVQTSVASKKPAKKKAAKKGGRA